jgi:hypothetical protein
MPLLNIIENLSHLIQENLIVILYDSHAISHIIVQTMLIGIIAHLDSPNILGKYHLKGLLFFLLINT